MRLPVFTRHFFLGALLSLPSHAVTADTDYIKHNRELLDLITDTADKMCKDIPLKGSGSDFAASGNLSAEVSGLAKKLTDAGAKIEGSYQSHEFQGLLQQDLLKALQNSTQCRLLIWKDLKGQFLPNAPAKKTQSSDAQPRPDDLELAKYINTGATKIAGKLNVAISVDGLSDTDDSPLEMGIGRALTNRGGYQVIPVFRTEFRRAGLGQKLFDGDPSLVTRLKLQHYCDAVVLGVLRFSAPAQQVADRLYIREAVLDIRVIDPLSGIIEKMPEIREKGGGATAQLSTENALDRLENSLEDSVKEWSWT
jgi:hypothetical protein